MQQIWLLIEDRSFFTTIDFLCLFPAVASPRTVSLNILDRWVFKPWSVLDYETFLHLGSSNKAEKRRLFG